MVQGRVCAAAQEEASTCSPQQRVNIVIWDFSSVSQHCLSDMWMRLSWGPLVLNPATE